MYIYIWIQQTDGPHDLHRSDTEQLTLMEGVRVHRTSGPGPGQAHGWRGDILHKHIVLRAATPKRLYKAPEHYAQT